MFATRRHGWVPLSSPVEAHLRYAARVLRRLVRVLTDFSARRAKRRETRLVSRQSEGAASLWRFQRDEAVLTVSCPSPVELHVSGALNHSTRRMAFHTVAQRLAFQSDFEAHLLDTGWTLVDFTPAARAKATGWRRLRAWRRR